jgi:hypothetical protein
MNVSQRILEELSGRHTLTSSPHLSRHASSCLRLLLLLYYLKRFVFFSKISRCRCYFKLYPLQTVPNHRPRYNSTDHEEAYPLHPMDKPVPLRRLLTYPVILSISNYMVLAFLNISFSAVLPLFLAMPVELGGLGFSPPLIGSVIGSYGAICGLFQAFCFTKIVRYLGVRFVFLIGMCSFLPAYMALPVMSVYARRFGVTIIVWIIIIMVLVLMTLMEMSYGSLLSF